MPYARSSSRRRSASTRGRSVSGYSRVRSSSRVRTRRTSARRGTSAGRNVTVRLVMEQAAPTVSPVITEDGKYALPTPATAKRAKF